MSAGLYIYGVAPFAAAIPAVPGGIGGAPASLLAAGGFAVLASVIESGPIARTRRNLLAHTSVLERALPHATLLPLRFGTVFPDRAALSACLEAHGGAFAASLHDMTGMVELGVKAGWREGVIYADIVDRDHGLRQLRDILRTRPAGETYYERIELGRRVEAALAQRRAGEARDILDVLLPLADRDAALRLTDDDMICNHAFLIRRTREAAFDAAMEKLAAAHGTRIVFRYIGPLPPFNFVTIQAGWSDVQTAARKVEPV
jgi:hypothetical protein